MIFQNVDVVILSESPHTMRSCGSYRIATELRKNNYTCQIIDFFSFLSIDDVYRSLSLCIGPRTKIVGFSTTFSDPLNIYGKEFTTKRRNEYSERIDLVIHYCKSLNSKIKIVLGGANVFAIENDLIDTRIIGYADLAFVRYIQWLDKKYHFFAYETDKNGQMIVNGDSYNQQFNFVESQIIYNQYDNIMDNESLVIEFSRGCIFKCKYCSFPLNGKNKNDYIKIKDTLYQELLRNYEEHGIVKYIASDDTHNDNIYKLEMLAEINQKLPFKFEYTTYMRIDLMRSNPEQYELLRNTGLVGAVFGIETLNHTSGKVIGKGLHPDKVVEELYKFRQELPNVTTSGSFIAGLPHETIKSIMSWTDKIRKIDFPLDTYTIVPLTIDFQDNRAFKSEMDTEWHKYFTVKDGIWHNGSFDREWAKNFCNSLYIQDIRRKRLRSGGFFAITNENLGFTNVRRMPYPNREQFAEKFKQKIIQYRNKLLS